MTDNDRFRATNIPVSDRHVTSVTGRVRVVSEDVQYTEDEIRSQYTYSHTGVKVHDDGSVSVTPEKRIFEFRTKTAVPKLGLMQVCLRSFVSLGQRHVR